MGEIMTEEQKYIDGMSVSLYGGERHEEAVAIAEGFEAAVDALREMDFESIMETLTEITERE